MTHDQESEVLKKVFNLFDIDIVFDVGANCGQYYKILRESVVYKGVVVSVEPTLELCNSLSSYKIADNNLFVENLAISDCSGVVKFYFTKNSQFSSLKLPTNSETQIFDAMNVVKEERVVQCLTLADLFRKYKDTLQFNCPFLKIDTQGNDVSVVRGGISIIQEFCGFQSELSVTPIYNNSIDFREALFFYQNLGFSIASMFLPNKGHFPELIDIDVVMLNKNMVINGGRNA